MLKVNDVPGDIAQDPWNAYYVQQLVCYARPDKADEGEQVYKQDRINWYANDSLAHTKSWQAFNETIDLLNKQPGQNVPDEDRAVSMRELTLVILLASLPPLKSLHLSGEVSQHTKQLESLARWLQHSRGRGKISYLELPVDSL